MALAPNIQELYDKKDASMQTRKEKRKTSIIILKKCQKSKASALSTQEVYDKRCQYAKKEREREREEKHPTNMISNSQWNLARTRSIL